MKKHIKWVIAHEPIDLFIKVADQFSAEVNEKTGGMFDIEVLSLTDYANKYNDGKKITKHDLIELVNTGAIEMSHIYSNWLGEFNGDLYALDLPFLFENHDHVDAVLEGAIGDELMAGVKANSNVRPMAFTYSGGYKIVPAKFNAANVDSWKGQEVRTSLSPVCESIFRTLGANTRKDIDLEVMTEYADRGEIEGGESTYVRVKPLKQDESFGFINETAHNLLLTNIIVNENFFGTLDADVQKIMSDAAFSAARAERKQSVADVPGIVAELKSRGVEVVALTAEQTEDLKKATAPVYDEYAGAFTPGLVDSIRNAK